MDNTKGRWRKIQWIGPGSNPSGLHTKTEFLEIMRIQYPERRYVRARGDREIPEGRFKWNDLNAWMAFTGAQYR